MKLLQKTVWAVCQFRSFNHISLQDIVPAASSSSQPRHERRRIIFADYEETAPSLRKVMSLKLVDKSKSFGGEQCVYTHFSSLLGCEMKFGVYLPPAVTELNQKCPVLYFLSGLTCTHENFIGKSGVQQHAAQHGLIIVNPDTSPRGLQIPGEDDSYDFGTGAGFYVNATEEPWSTNYKMFSYVTEELPSLVNESLPVLENKVAIFGHSMGGHGALICALKNPQLYKSVSAFAPICNPSASSWGKKALSGYLGEKTDAWAEWDATRLAEKYNGPPREIFIDQGSADKFLQSDLLPDNLLKAAVKNGNLQTIYKLREGYGHDYFYIATFISEHIAYHAKMLKA